MLGLHALVFNKDSLCLKVVSSVMRATENRVLPLLAPTGNKRCSPLNMCCTNASNGQYETLRMSMTLDKVTNVDWSHTNFCCQISKVTSCINVQCSM